MSYPRVNLLVIDKHMNTSQIELPAFMLRQLNIDSDTVKKHDTKRELNTTVSEFLADKQNV